MVRPSTRSVETYRGDTGDEELGPIGIRASIGHTECVGPVMTELRVELVLKLSSPDGFSSSTITCVG